MSDLVSYLRIVSKMFNLPASEAIHLPLVMGNHAVACYYVENDVKFRFAGQGRITS